MMDIITSLVILFIAMVFHEIGHYIGFRACGFKPSLRFSFGACYIGENIWHKTTVRQSSAILLLGIATGFAAVLYTDPAVKLTYLLMCSIDFASLFANLEIKKVDRNKTMLEVAKKQILELEQKVKRDG